MEKTKHGPAPASSIFFNRALACECKGASDYCYHCGRDVCGGAPVVGPCSILKRQYDTMVAEGIIAPFPEIAAATSTSGWLQTVRPAAPTTLQWDEDSTPRDAATGPFQPRVDPWLLACFGEEIARDPEERNHRFLEEALELAQACDCTASEAHQLVDYVFGRPMGDAGQEVGGVMITLAALCLARGLDMHAAGEAELARIWTKVEKIRAKQAAKPKHSPLAEEPNVAACIAQLDVWNGRLEAAIDRQAHAQLGQHANDEPAAGGRDPMEQLP